MRQEVMLGNQAIGRGLVESGCHVVMAYPGTPSSEILPEVVRFKKELGLNTYVEWATNEKAAFEVALAASYAGKRAAVAMKQVGLNVASDPLLSAAYLGVKGGFVVIACDDPGPHSSQTEQDTRLFALFAKVPVLDPSTPREAKEMTRTAFELSEKYEVPVILRPTTRVCHAKQNVPFGPVELLERRPAFVKDPARWAATPRFRYLLHQELNQKLASIEAEFESSPLNVTLNGHLRSPLGIIAGGACYTGLMDILGETDLEDEVAVLKIGTPYPLPRRLVADFMARCERVLVLEEPDAAIELQLGSSEKLLGRRTGTVPSAGELTPEVIYGVLAQVVSDTSTNIEMAALPEQDCRLDTMVKDLKLPVRKPRLCPGCPHRSSFFAIRLAFGGRAIFPSDIGCYTLGLNQRAVDTVLDMGAAINMAAGFYHAHRQDGMDRPIVATIGDSTFLHSGVPALVNAVYGDARFILVILDNGVTAMTGFQPTADSGRLADGSAGNRVPIEGLVRACGVRFVQEIDPYEVQAFTKLLKDAHAFTHRPDGGIAVIIARRACVLYDRRPVVEHPVKVTITDECDGCRYCVVAFECPALVLNTAANVVEIDRRICIDCGQCIEACYKGFIVPIQTTDHRRQTTDQGANCELRIRNSTP